MNLRPGEIVTILFPFSKLDKLKQRPVIIISPIDKFGDFICLAITSKETHEQAMRIDDKAIENGLLPKTSFIRYDKIFTLNSLLVKNRIGSLKNDKYMTLKKLLCSTMGCS